VKYEQLSLRLKIAPYEEHKEPPADGVASDAGPQIGDRARVS
jgi:hypothetical protein